MISGLKPYAHILDSYFGDAQYVSFYLLEDFKKVPKESSKGQCIPQIPVECLVQGPLLIFSRPCNWVAPWSL
jgi:hypothetical protein